MKRHFTGTGTSLTGVAVLAACACGTSSGIARVASSFGISPSLRSIHPLFLAVGGALIVTGLWVRNRKASILALAAMLLLGLGEILAPPMSIRPALQLTAVQISGLITSLISAAFLVSAFFIAFPSDRPGSALLAISGAAMVEGCSCCLVTMGITGLMHGAFPSQPWLSTSLPVYVGAAVLMSVGLYRLGGIVPAAVAVAGQAFVYYWLELPYGSLPAVHINGVNANFVIKYPMMLCGALVVMFGFVLAYRKQENTVSHAALEPSFSD